MSLETALESLKRGEFVLLFDSAGRENEIDMMVAAEFVTPEHVARMRQHAGGLLCIAIDNQFANSLELKYMHEILSDSSISNKEMIMGLAPYGDHPTFSLSVNHYQTYTGITDNDRSLTIREMANIYNVENKQKNLHHLLKLLDMFLYYCIKRFTSSTSRTYRNVCLSYTDCRSNSSNCNM